MEKKKSREESLDLMAKSLEGVEFTPEVLANGDTIQMQSLSLQIPEAGKQTVFSEDFLRQLAEQGLVSKRDTASWMSFLSGRNNLRNTHAHYIRNVNAGSFARRSLLYLQTLSDATFGSSYFTIREGLQSYLLTLTLEGEGLLRYEGREYNCLPGDAFFIDCRRAHDYRTFGVGSWRYRMVHFNGVGAAEYFEQILRSGGVHFRFSQDSRFSALFEQLMQENNAQSPQQDLRNNVLMVQLLTELLLTLPAYNSELYPPKIQEIVFYLEKHAASDLSIDEIAAEFYMSKFHLCREFHRYTGETVFSYIRSCRMKLAKTLLRTTNAPITAIAEAAGYDNISCFSRAFKASENEAPGEYRRQWSVR